MAPRAPDNASVLIVDGFSEAERRDEIRPPGVLSPLPRKPTRANGAVRYRLLVEAVETLIEEGGTSAVTIQAVAKQAGVPMPSVYHFFPSPIAACIAASESHQEALAEIIAKAATISEEDDLDVFLMDIERQIVDYYNAHPIARRLILGSDCSWHIRQLDLQLHDHVARMGARLFARRFGAPPGPAVEEAIATCATIVEAIWSLSIAKNDRITEYYTKEAHRAAAAYARTILRRPD